MSFSISLLPEVLRSPDSDEVSALGIIRLGDFQETFSASLSYWNAGQYRRHWLKAATRLVGMETTSCLITSMFDPAIANFIIWQPMYRRGDIVYIQNQILFLEEQPKPFNERDPFSSVAGRETSGEDGKLSEWTVSIKDLEAFLLADSLLRAA